MSKTGVSLTAMPLYSPYLEFMTGAHVFKPSLFVGALELAMGSLTAFPGRAAFELSVGTSPVGLREVEQVL